MSPVLHPRRTEAHDVLDHIDDLLDRLDELTRAVAADHLHHDGDPDAAPPDPA